MRPQICKNKPEEVIKQKTICIVQLTRFGDLIQSMQAVSGLLADKDEEYRIILVARKRFSKHLKFLTDQYFEQQCVLPDSHKHSYRSYPYHRSIISPR